MTEYKIEKETDCKYENGIFFFKLSTEPNFVSADAHIHNAIEIIWVDEGDFTVYVDDDKYEIFAGDVILFRSNVIHRIVSGTSRNNSYYVLKIKHKVIRDLAPEDAGGAYLLNFVLKRIDSKCVWKKSEAESIREMASGLQLLKTECDGENKYKDIAWKIGAGSVLLGMLRYGADEGINIGYDKSDRLVDGIYKAMNFINRNYKEDITGRDVCTEVGMSYCYFSRNFKLVTGTSFKEYLNITRVNHAEQLLATTDKSISDICFECGYNDVSYFIKVYREHKMVAPGKFRNIKNQSSES